MRSNFVILSLLLLMILSCYKDKEIQYLELTSGLAMDPHQGRFGIKIISDNYFYICKEIMDIDSEKIDHHTGKYKYYKSVSKIDFIEYQALISTNFAKEKRLVFHSIADAEAYQIKYHFYNGKDKYRFYSSNLNEKQNYVIEMLENLRHKKFKEIDSIEFSSDLLQEKLPEPPKL